MWCLNWHIFLPTPKGLELGKVTLLEEGNYPDENGAAWGGNSHSPVTGMSSSLCHSPSLNCSFETGTCELSWFSPCLDSAECPTPSQSLPQPGAAAARTPCRSHCSPVAAPRGRAETILGAVCREVEPFFPPAAAAAWSSSGCYLQSHPWSFIPEPAGEQLLR